MKTKMSFLVSAAVLFSSCYGQSDAQLPCVEEREPNRIYFGPEFLCYRLHTHVKDVTVRGTRFFSGVRVGYEYLKPDDFYAGIDFLYSFSDIDFKGTAHHEPLSWHKADKGLANLEVRLGYTFTPKEWMTTPFLGVGGYRVFSLDRHDKDGFKEKIPYVAVGTRSMRALGDTFNIGINWKVLYSMITDREFKYEGGKATTHGHMWGAEIGVPLVWNIGFTDRWDIQIEPYFLKLDLSSVQNIYGTRFLLGYRF